MEDRTLSIGDLHKVSDELKTVAPEWYQLGLALGLRSDRLDIIKADNPLRTIDCFTEMLKAWLQNTLPEPMWEDLTEALDSIGERWLAQRVRVQNCEMKLVPVEDVQPHRLPGIIVGQNQRIGGYYKFLRPLMLSITMICLSSILLQNQVHESDAYQSHQSHDPKLPHQFQMCGVPYLTKDVIGRNTEAENVIRLISFRVRIVSIVGPPGIGKSTLAKYVGHKLANNRGVEVYYIDMSGVTNISAIAEKILDCAQPSQESVTSVQRWGHAIDHRTVLLLDNADEILQTHWNEFEKQVQILLESSPYIKVIITSQMKQFYVHLSAVYEEVSLKVLSTHYACTLLQEITSSLTPQQAETIAELTGNMPLALTVIGALIKYSPYSPGSIINKLRNEPVSTFSQTRYINASISVSYEYLDNQLKKFIHFIANFPGSFDDVSVTEIVNVYTNSPIARSDVLEMLQSLLERSLIEYDREKNRYNFHSLIRTHIIRVVAEVDRIRFSIAFQHYYSQVLINLSQTLTSDLLATTARFNVEQHNIEHFLYLFETLQLTNHTVYCRALDSIQLKGLIPCIIKQCLDTPINSEHRHINGSQTLDSSVIVETIEFFLWNSNSIKELVIISDLLHNCRMYNSHMKIPFTRVLNIAIVHLKQFLLNVTPVLEYIYETQSLNIVIVPLKQFLLNVTPVLEYTYETQSSNYVSIGDAYYILGIDSKGLQFYQLALTHQQLLLIQQFYVNMRIYEIYVKMHFSEKAKTVLHKLSQFYPVLELVPASVYIEYNYEMREIIRFLYHHELSRADSLIEKEILAYDQLQVSTACIHFSMLNNWKELIYRKTYQRDFNKASELGATVIRVYERQGECHPLLHSFPLHLIVSHIYYYTGIAMYGSNSSVDYLLHTLDATESETGYFLLYKMRLRVCWVLVSHGHHYCSKQLYLHAWHGLEVVNITLKFLAYIFSGYLISRFVWIKLDYTIRKLAISLFSDKYLCITLTVTLISVLNSYHPIVPDIMLIIVLLLIIMIVARRYNYTFYMVTCVIIFYILMLLTLLPFLVILDQYKLSSNPINIRLVYWDGYFHSSQSFIYIFISGSYILGFIGRFVRAY